MKSRAQTFLDRLSVQLSKKPKKILRKHSLTPAAVLLLLYCKGGQYHVLLNERTQEVEYHKGEISFPGGTQDAEDSNLLDTALREGLEEMGIQPEDVVILGELDAVRTKTNFLVQPYVGVIPYPYKFHLSTREVASVLEIPLSILLDPENCREEVWLIDSRLERKLSYGYDKHLIYGATAKILSQFLEMV